MIIIVNIIIKKKRVYPFNNQVTSLQKSKAEATQTKKVSQFIKEFLNPNRNKIIFPFPSHLVLTS